MMNILPSGWKHIEYIIELQSRGYHGNPFDGSVHKLIKGRLT